MLRRFLAALRLAMRDSSFAAPASAAVALVVIGTLTYALGQGWSPVDALYFAVCTLTTSSVADPDLELTRAWLKVFTILYILTGIGILVELARRLGLAFIASRAAGGRTPRDRGSGR
jgi:hypothetical protein